MKIQESLGVDVSKAHLDAFLYQSKKHQRFTNNEQGFKQLLQWSADQSNCPMDQVCICFEHTGLYSMGLAIFLNDQQIKFTLESALRIKRSLGLTRGKNDQVDAQRIATYAWRRKEELVPTVLPAESLLKLRALLSQRQLLVKQRAAQKAALKSDYSALRGGLREMKKVQQQLIKQLDQYIGQLEHLIQNTIDQDEELGKLFRLVTSVVGIGPIVAANLLVTTDGFKRFANGRQFACYAGLAPFAQQSGTSLNSKSRVSHLAIKKNESIH